MTSLSPISPSLESAFQKWKDLFQSFGIDVSSDGIQRVKRYVEELKSRNESVSLISYKSDEELVVSHVIDSLVVLQTPAAQSPEPRKCIDVGSGGGFPGAALALMRPEWSFTLLDSINKKQAFLQIVLDKFAAPGHRALWGRAEELAQQPEHREQYDMAFCRAVGRFTTGLELTLPLLKVGGLWLAHRGTEGPEEAKAAESALTVLGGKINSIFPYRLPGMDNQRHIVIVEKARPTPAGYPRRPGIPAKKPL